MKNSLLFAALFAGALAFQACNTTETHDRSVDKPAGSEHGPQSGEVARENIGEDTDEAGKAAADDYGDRGR